MAFSPEALRDLAWLSRVPDTFGVAATAKTAAWAADAWIPVGRVAASEQTGAIGDRPYRLVVYRSSSLDRRKAKTLERELARARASAERAADALCADDFACAADAEAAVAAFRATAPRWWPCTTTVGPVTVTEKRAHRGRPRRDDPAPTHTVYRVQVTWGPRDEAAVRTALERRSPCVLITTLPATRYDAAALLREVQGADQRGAAVSLPEGPGVRGCGLSEETGAD